METPVRQQKTKRSNRDPITPSTSFVSTDSATELMPQLQPRRSATIVALATAPAMGAVGILRLSGPLALEVSRRLAEPLPETVEPRHAYFVSFQDRKGRKLDQGLFLYFRGPHSFTGEDVVELQTHGSPALLELLQAELLADDRIRLAEPGEFSRRAFLNNRIDLSQAEAVAELVAARSAAAVRAAAAQLNGSLTRKVRTLRDEVVGLYADIEGELNFPDEAAGASSEYQPRLAQFKDRLTVLSENAGRGRLIREGALVVLFGRVNAGKSTLFNVLVGEERALVDEEPGTTRDFLEARIELEGLPVRLVDTAGLRPAPGRVEALGIARAEEVIRSADLAVLVSPPEEKPDEIAQWMRVGQGSRTILVRSKSDLGLSDPSQGIWLSAKTGQGVAEFRRVLRETLWEGDTPAAVYLLSSRQESAIQRALEAISRAELASEISTLEVVSGEVGVAVEALGEVTGENSSEELLDEIFRRFCIGK